MTITTGQTLEVTLAWGQSPLLTGRPDASVLRLDTPAGYAESSDRECIWHFTPVAMGQTSLTYTIRPICSTTQTCPTAGTVLRFVVVVTANEPQ